MIRCEKLGCVANLNGECVNDECKGEIIQMPPCEKSDREMMKKWYNMKADTFNREFLEADIKEQMRQEGLCEEDIELAASTIQELKKKEGGRMAEYIERKKLFAAISRFVITKSAADFTHYEDGRDNAITELIGGESE